MNINIILVVVFEKFLKFKEIKFLTHKPALFKIINNKTIKNYKLCLIIRLEIIKINSSLQELQNRTTRAPAVAAPDHVAEGTVADLP